MEKSETARYIDEIQEMSDQLAEEKAKSANLNQVANSIFSGEDNENLIKWQLDLNEELERIWHLLQGHEIKFDKEGFKYYVEPKDPNLKPFNEYGVKILMNIMAFYLNRNTILSNYDSDTIDKRVFDIGNEIADLIFTKYEEMMVTISIRKEIEKITGKEIQKLPNGRYVANLKYMGGEIYYDELPIAVLNHIDEILAEHIYQKIKLYPMIVLELTDSIESAYNRSLHGGERESLRTARSVVQSEPLGKQPQVQQVHPRSKFSVVKPWTWDKL